ncbi:hypothetical protein G7Z17_g11841 [Cylindrodendrum hubeiense]|uniref:Uncharacterized protein n=1 Tax=Cylindrodendrum hubeiense TaxID=595255 RepID=A0A9P5L3L4_9HYPO|nr:hypothetical protein G7Z17_g11841 [Cylindrodendrum hubeiense]
MDDDFETDTSYEEEFDEEEEEEEEASKPSGMPREPKGPRWIDDALAFMKAEFEVKGVKFDQEENPDPDHPLSALFNQTREAIIEHYRDVPKDVGPGKKKSHSDSKLVRRVKTSLQDARDAYMGGGYIQSGKHRCHWIKKVPPQAEILATRFVTKFCTLNPSVGGALAIIGMSHLATITLNGGGPQTGSTTQGAGVLDAVALNAASVAATTLEKLEKVEKRLKDLESANEDNNYHARLNDS